MSTGLGGDATVTEQGATSTEDDILAAAGVLFDRKGFNRTSVKDIAEALGMSRPALYHYFANRDEMLVAGIERVNEARDAMTTRLSDAEASVDERLRLLMVGFAQLMRENPVWVRIALRDSPALPPAARERERSSRLAYYELLLATVKDGIQEGHVRPFDERVIALTIISTLAGLRGPYIAEVDIPSDAAADLAVDMLLHGLMVVDDGQGRPVEQGVRLIREGLAVVERLS